MVRRRGITPTPLKSFWSCIQTIYKRENCLAWIMGLQFERAHIILAVIVVMMNLNASVSKIGWRNERETFVQSPKRQVNILRKDIMWSSMQSDWREFFGICDEWYRKPLTGVEKFFRKPFCDVFFFRISKTLSPVVGALNTLLVNKTALGLQNTEYTY